MCTFIRITCSSRLRIVIYKCTDMVTRKAHASNVTYHAFLEISEKFRNFWKIREFPENPGISENPGETFRDFGENFFSEFPKF
jgi:hypothetical protein